jgi:SOS-response transcriptional repressors (recA-mediated autopeptidases)|nr:MAG TPA: SOS-response transcriptional repressors (RecA-mediated autopeptidases) [Caudoviricetes sp.]
MTIGERIKEVRERLGLNQVEFADKINVSKQTLYKYENNLITNIPSDKIEATAKLGNVSPAYIMGWEKTEYLSKISNVFPIELKKFPLLGEISCGVPKFANEDRESYVLAGSDIQADFCLRASGDSMINARISDGDIVFIRKQDIVDNGEIAAVVVNNDSDATLKRLYYYQEKSLLILKAENPKYKDLIFSGDELNNVHILGKAIAFQSDVI